MKVRISIDDVTVAYIELCDKQDGNTEITIVNGDPMEYFEIPDTVPDNQVLWFMQRAIAQMSQLLMMANLPSKYLHTAPDSPINN